MATHIGIMDWSRGFEDTYCYSKVMSAGMLLTTL